jgi:hypothetical protein
MTADRLVERGANLLTLEQLLGSIGIFGTFVTQFELRMYTSLAFLLVGLWALSPLEAQSILRIISIEDYTDQSLVSKLYLNTSAGKSSALSESVPIANSLFLGALIAPKSTQDLALGKRQDPTFWNLWIRTQLTRVDGSLFPLKMYPIPHLLVSLLTKFQRTAM